MKKIIITIISLVTFIYGTSDFSKHDAKFDSLSQKRDGLTNQEINSLPNPFTKKNNDQVSIRDIAPSELIGKELTAIIANKAKINNSWHILGDYIGSYRIMSIGTDRVFLENEKNKIELKLKKGNQNVVISY
ncbi:MAG: hypothetical protein GXZ15_01780 [Campylobacter sp.]|nr:hypothetical protein [Campylobacter sp.]